MGIHISLIQDIGRPNILTRGTGLIIPVIITADRLIMVDHPIMVGQVSRFHLIRAIIIVRAITDHVSLAQAFGTAIVITDVAITTDVITKMNFEPGSPGLFFGLFFCVKEEFLISVAAFDRRMI